MTTKLILTMLAGATALALGAPATAKPATVKGTLMDESCASMPRPHDNDDHKSPADMRSCALSCTRRGEPVALVTAEGKIYRVVGGLAANKNAGLIPHLGHTVEITGEVSRRGIRMQIAADSLNALAR